MALKDFKRRPALNSKIEEEESQEEEDSQEEEESHEEDGKFETYDPVLWATATEEETVDKVRDEKNIPEPHLSHTDEAVPDPSGVPTSPIIRDSKDLETKFEQTLLLSPRVEPEFVRALRTSKMNTKPYFQKGHILRVINKARRGKLDGELDRVGVDGQVPNFI